MAAGDAERRSHILASYPADGVCLLRLNCPRKLNVFSGAMRRALIDHLQKAQADDAIRVALVAGSPRAFVAGADLSEVAQANPVSLESSGLHHVWEALDSFPKPIVMAVRGYCLGAGCELLMHGDIGIVAEDAKIGQPEIRVGIQPGAGGLSRLVTLVGYQRAMRLALTGEAITGAQAAQWGLASESAPPEDVEGLALAISSKLASLSAPRLRSIKKVAREGLDRSLTDQIANERRAYWASFGTSDQREGMNAFLEKRKPQFNRD